MRLCLAIFILTTSVVSFAQPPAVRWSASHSQAAVSAQPTKKDILAKLKTMQEQQITESTDLDNAIRKQLNESMTLEVDKGDLGLAGRRTNLVTKKIEELNKRRGELNARREIVDRLIFQIDSKWNGQNLQQFLTQSFIEMASTDLSDGRDNRLWKAFTYLSMVTREVPEPNDDLIALIEGYLKYSSVLEPKTPADFIASRNYTNGLDYETAHASLKEDAGKENAGDGSMPSKILGPMVIKTNLGVTETPKAPLATTPLDETLSGATSPPPAILAAAPAAPITAPTPPAQATPAQAPFVNAQKTTNDKAKALTGQVPGPAEPAGSADSPQSLNKTSK